MKSVFVKRILTLMISSFTTHINSTKAPLIFYYVSMRCIVYNNKISNMKFYESKIVKTVIQLTPTNRRQSWYYIKSHFILILRLSVLYYCKCYQNTCRVKRNNGETWQDNCHSIVILLLHFLFFFHSFHECQYTYS